MLTFRLKNYLCGAPARQAEVSLGGSYIEPYSLKALLGLDPELEQTLLQTPLHYPGTEGSEPVRTAVAQRYALSAEQVILTEGADGAISALFSALFDESSKVAVQMPCYEPLQAQVKLNGAEVIAWQSVEEHAWQPDLNYLESLLNKGLDAVVINVPHNPTGWMPNEDFCTQLIGLCERYQTRLIADEIYLGLPVERPFMPFAQRWSGAISIGGLSKAFGMPGLRVGWLAGQDESVINAVKQARSFSNAFIGAPSEVIGLSALQHARAILKSNSQQRQKGLEQIQAFVEHHADVLSWQSSQGGVTGFFRLRDGLSTANIAETLLADYHTLVVPSILFDAGDQHLRLGFGQKDLSKGLERVSEYFDTLESA